MNRYTIKHFFNLLWPSRKSFQRFYIAITDRCNLHCIMCTTTTHQSKVEDELTVNQWEAIIKNITRHTVESIGFGGGEPLLRKDDIAELIPQITKQDIRVDIVTNGTYLEEAFLKQLLPHAGKMFFVVSLDGLKKENDGIRGGGVFEKVIRAMDLLRRYSYKFCVSSVLMPQNFSGYKDFLSFISTHYPDTFIDIQPVIPHNEIYYQRNIFTLTEEELQALKGILQFLKEKRDIIKLSRPLDVINRYWDYFTNTLYVEKQCKMGTTCFNINSRGNIWICGKEIEYPLYRYKIEDVMKAPVYLEEMKRVENCRVPCLQGLVL